MNNPASPSQKFLAELIDLMQRYNVHLEEFKCYDRDELYTGSQYDFISDHNSGLGEDICLSVEDVCEAQERHKSGNQGSRRKEG